MAKEVKKRITKDCAICGKVVRVIVYADSSYRGGNCFGKVPLYTKKAFREASKAGYVEKKWGTFTVQVMKKEAIAYKYVEYWECPKCYWRG